MEKKESIKWLRIPLYRLIYEKDLEYFNGLNNDELKNNYSHFSNEELKNILEAIKWGVENPEFDFSSLLPYLNQSNKDIYNYLCIMYKQISSLAEEREKMV